MKIIRIVKLIIILCLLQFINSINEKEKSKQIFHHEIIDSHVTINPTVNFIYDISNVPVLNLFLHVVHLNLKLYIISYF